MYREHTQKELIKVVRSADGSKAFLELLKRTVEKVADVRLEIIKGEDSLELRNGVVRVIEEMLLQPLTKKVQKKEAKELNDYT